MASRIKGVLIAAALVLGIALLPHAAQAVVLDFQAMADGNEGSWSSRTGMKAGGEFVVFGSTKAFQIDGIQVVAEGFNGTEADAYLDDFFNGAIAGLGVCQNFSGTQCDPSSDDNVTSGETLKLSFYDLDDNPIDVTLIVAIFLDSQHETNFPIDDSGTDPLIDITVTPFGGVGDLTQFVLSSSLNFMPAFTGHMFEFAYVNSEFYLASATVSVPEPAAIMIFVFGLAGLGLVGRRRRLRLAA